MQCRRVSRADAHTLATATPSRSRLPATYSSSSPFCRTCQSNQSLQIHLLAAYPSDDDDDHPIPHLLPEYQQSLDARYPMVCPNCAPAVEQDIAEKDARARSAALGWRLRESQKGLRMMELKESERRNSWRWWWLGLVWRARGVAFWCTHASGIIGCAAGESYQLLFAIMRQLTSLTPQLLLDRGTSSRRRTPPPFRMAGCLSSPYFPYYGSPGIQLGPVHVLSGPSVAL